MDNTLFGAKVVNKVTTNHCDGPVGEPDRDLRQVFGGCKGRYLAIQSAQDFSFSFSFSFTFCSKWKRSQA